MIRKHLAILLISCLLFGGCAEHKTIGNTTYKSYGLANQNEANPDVVYKLSAQNIVIGIIGFAVAFEEMSFFALVIPIYVVLEDLWEPVALKDGYTPGIVAPEGKEESTSSTPPVQEYVDPKYNRYK